MKPNPVLWYPTYMARRTLTAALAILLALPMSASAVLYTCRLDGVTRTSCCCDKGVQHPCCPSHKDDSGCCDVSIQSIDNEALRSAIPSVPTPLVVILRASPILHSQEFSTSRHIPLATLPVALGPPLFVQKSAYLL